MKRRFNVKVKPLKLEGFCKENIDEDGDGGREKSIVVQMKWNGPKSVFVPFYRSSSKRHRRSCRTGQRFLRNREETIEWDEDEFESICDFSIVSKDGSFGSWVVSFAVLYGEIGDGVSKTNQLVSLGKASLNLAEVVAAKMESKVEQKLPIISSNADGAATDATLLVCVSFVEIRSLEESSGHVQNSTESEKGDAFFKLVMGLTGYNNEKKKNQAKGHKGGQKDQARSCSSGSDESPLLDSSDGSPGNEPMIVSTGSSKDGFFNSWKKRRLSFGQSKRKGEPLIRNTNVVKHLTDNPQPCSRSNVVHPITSTTTMEEDVTPISLENDSCNPIDWELKELISRDGQTKLKSKVFFASFDQRSEKATGESACTALVAVIADWLHSNQDIMPTRQKYDRLIAEGSSEWRKLCNNEAYTNLFPDKHFDLETVLEAGLRPITVLPQKSFTGFFSPEKFKTLQGAMSFDEIWDEISNQTEYYGQPSIYIVSWNDHFFVLKVEADAYYIIDSLGERLFVGCNQAYILKFDDSTSMYAKVARDEVGSVDITASDKNVSHKDDEYSTSTVLKVAREEVGSNNMVGYEEMICSGKECCREYIKRFLASIALGEHEAEEKKGTACTFFLHRRLQIDFHYSSSATSSLSSSATSSTHSLITSG